MEVEKEEGRRKNGLPQNTILPHSTPVHRKWLLNLRRTPQLQPYQAVQQHSPQSRRLHFLFILIKANSSGHSSGSNPWNFLVPNSRTTITVTDLGTEKLGPDLFLCIFESLPELFRALKAMGDGPLQRGYFRWVHGNVQLYVIDYDEQERQLMSYGILVDALRGLGLLMEQQERAFGAQMEIFDGNTGHVGRVFIRRFD